MHLSTKKILKNLSLPVSGCSCSHEEGSIIDGYGFRSSYAESRASLDWHTERHEGKRYWKCPFRCTFVFDEKTSATISKSIIHFRYLHLTAGRCFPHADVMGFGMGKKDSSSSSTLHITLSCYYLNVSSATDFVSWPGPRVIPLEMDFNTFVSSWDMHERYGWSHWELILEYGTTMEKMSTTFLLHGTVSCQVSIIVPFFVSPLWRKREYTLLQDSSQLCIHIIFSLCLLYAQWSQFQRLETSSPKQNCKQICVLRSVWPNQWVCSRSFIGPFVWVPWSQSETSSPFARAFE